MTSLITPESYNRATQSPKPSVIEWSARWQHLAPLPLANSVYTGLNSNPAQCPRTSGYRAAPKQVLKLLRLQPYLLQVRLEQPEAGEERARVPLPGALPQDNVRRPEGLPGLAPGVKGKIHKVNLPKAPGSLEKEGPRVPEKHSLLV